MFYLSRNQEAGFGGDIGMKVPTSPAFAERDRKYFGFQPAAKRIFIQEIFFRMEFRSI